MKKEIKVFDNVIDYFQVYIIYETSSRIVERRYTLNHKYKKTINILVKIFEELNKIEFECLLHFISSISFDYNEFKKEDKKANGKTKITTC